MSYHYSLSSNMIAVPEEKREQAQAIIDRVSRELEEDEDEGYFNYKASLEPEGVWLRHDESFNPEHAQRLVRALVEELDLPGVHVCSWAYSCDRPLLDAFGGGAFAVQKGLETVWVDAGTAVLDMGIRPLSWMRRKPETTTPT